VIRLWDRFVDATRRPVDTRPMALLRILVPLCIVFDLLRAVQVGMAPYYWRRFDAGGLSAFSGDDFVLGVLGPDAGLIVMGVVLVSMVAVSLGVGVRPAIVVGVLAYAQLGHLYPPGDRGVDRVLRMVLMLLLFTPAHRRWALGNRITGRAPVTEMPAGAVLVLQWFLVILYLNAGIAKILQQPKWLALSGTPVLYRIMADPLAGRLDHLAWLWAWPLFRVGTWGTIVLELTSLLLLTRWAPWWGILGALMHVGIFATMHLGMFSLGMLSMYVVVFGPWWVPALDRWLARRATASP
jgi:hypothetical protein